jgi:hypothetical protein
VKKVADIREQESTAQQEDAADAESLLDMI